MYFDWTILVSQNQCILVQAYTTPRIRPKSVTQLPLPWAVNLVDKRSYEDMAVNVSTVHGDRNMVYEGRWYTIRDCILQ